VGRQTVRCGASIEMTGCGAVAFHHTGSAQPRMTQEIKTSAIRKSAS
jgi:hypothetical protein